MCPKKAVRLVTVVSSRAREARKIEMGLVLSLSGDLQVH